LLWHLQSGLVDFGSLSDHDCCCSLTSGVFGELDGGALIVVGERILFGADIFMMR
jgi:hypothetical protein